MAAPINHRLDGFIRANTAVLAPPLVPEVRLHLATEIVPLWRKTEEELEREGIPPPFWAFAWAGGQALARYILDHPAEVGGKAVLDLGAGSGLVAIAAAKAGASSVLAADVDRFAIAATRLNAELNGVTLSTTGEDLIGSDATWSAILVADMCYERPLADGLLLAAGARTGRRTSAPGRPAALLLSAVRHHLACPLLRPDHAGA